MSTSEAAVAQSVLAAADRLEGAVREGVPVEPVRDLIDRGDITAAYAVQQLLTERRTSAGARIVGRKIGITSEAVQRQVGVDQPDFGVLFDDMAYLDGTVIPLGVLLQPKAEAEIAFVLGSDLDHGALDREVVADAVEYALAALEIVDSRVRDWDITIADTIADNASSGAYVLGTNRLRLDEFKPVDVEMAMHLDGHEVSAGNGRACLGDPLNALTWLASTAHRLGSPLRRGDVMLSGALGPMVALAPGQTIDATLSRLGTVSISLSDKEPA